jgi:ribosomal-protein-alanine N-acetyltransferase
MSPDPRDITWPVVEGRILGMRLPVLRSDRLTLTPLREAELASMCAAVTDTPLGDVCNQWLAAVRADPQHLIWHTNWELRRRADDVVVGGACFKGPPNAVGQVEIGYGVEARERGRGYATEAVMRLLNWAFQQPGVETVIAETAADNLASQRVLEKAGLKRSGDTGQMVWWMVARR